MNCRECGRINAEVALYCSKCQTKLYLSRLKIIMPDGKSFSHYLHPRKYRIGRGEDNDIIIPDISVSRHHASLDYSSGVFSITDNHGVEKRGNRLRVDRTRATGNDQRIPIATILPAKRDSGQIEHSEHIRIGKLIL